MIAFFWKYLGLIIAVAYCAVGYYAIWRLAFSNNVGRALSLEEMGEAKKKIAKQEQCFCNAGNIESIRKCLEEKK